MAFNSRDARRGSVTPGWAWAVAGLCGLLLIPVALENNHLAHIGAPLHVASPAYHPAELHLAGHGAARSGAGAGTRTHAPNAQTGTSPRRSATAGRAGEGAGGVVGVVSTGGVGDTGGAGGVGGADLGGTSTPDGGLDLKSPTGALSTGGATVPSVTAAARDLVGDTHVATGVAASDRPWNELGKAGAASPVRQKAAPSTALIQPRPVTPVHRYWIGHIRHSGPASRVRRRRQPRFFGFYVTTTVD